MKKRRNSSITSIALLAGLAFGVVITLVFVQRHLNTIQIESIVEQADERGLDYEVTIHEPITNSYSFRAFEKNK